MVRGWAHLLIEQPTKSGFVCDFFMCVADELFKHASMPGACRCTTGTPAPPYGPSEWRSARDPSLAGLIRGLLHTLCPAYQASMGMKVLAHDLLLDVWFQNLAL